MGRIRRKKRFQLIFVINRESRALLRSNSPDYRYQYLSCTIKTQSMKTLLCALLLLPISLLAQDQFLKRYSGSYSIMVGSDGSEAYALAENGSAVWVYGWKDSSGKLQTQKKSGNWTAKEGYIKVTIQGNTGAIVQEYKLTNGRFVSVDDSRAYLKKN